MSEKMEPIKGSKSEHPQRYALTNELHARPFEQLSAPARMSMYACLDTAKDGEVFAHLNQLCEQYGVLPPKPELNHFSADFGPFRLRFERHTEFFSYTVIRIGEYDRPFEKPAETYLPKAWLSELPGQLLVATHLALLGSDGPQPDAQQLAELFVSDSLVSSTLSGGAAQVWTDLRIHADGHNRILVKPEQLPPHKAGRMMQWLLEIAAYRNFALLALPVARALNPELTRIDQGLANLTSEMAALADAATDDQSAQRESDLLDQLMQLSSEIESINSKHNYRFAASKAYFALVRSRLEELREDQYDGFQTIGEFLDRRLVPAMRTCESVSEHMVELSERATRAANLLQTRVDFFLQRQNQNVLGSLNRRARMQLRLQQTVEGLSVVAISYYTVGLVGYVAKGLHELGITASATLIQAASVPVVGGLIWWALRRLRGELEKV